MPLAILKNLCRTSIALFAIAALAVCQQAEASIHTVGLGPGLSSAGLGDSLLDPEALDNAVEQLTKSESSTGAGRSKQANRQTAMPWPPAPERSSENRLQHAFLPGQSTSGSTTTTTSSPGGAPGGVSPAMLTTRAPQLTDNSPTERYAIECTLFLPDAPANELLRPPQA